MATTHDAKTQDALRQEIIGRLDSLSLEQLRQVIGYMDHLNGQPRGMSGKEFVDLMRELQDRFQVTPEEAEEFDRILREGREAMRPRSAADIRE